MSVSDFERLLTKATSALDAARLSDGMAPCVAALRQARVAQAFRDAVEVATTPTQRCSAQLALCSAYLTFSRLGSNVKEQLSYVEHAFSVLVEANKQEVSPRTAAPYKACITTALEILADPEANLNCGLSFWSRLVKTVPRHWRPMLYQLSMNQSKWILNQGLQCMTVSPYYKTGLKCGHEATGPVELAVQCALSCGNRRYISQSEQLRKDIYTFIRCTCESVQARRQADEMLAGFGPCPHEEQMWHVVDKYTQAVRQTEESDILNECQAHARLGMIFDKHLNLRHKAVLNCKRAVQLGHTIRPTPIGADWFMESEAILRKIQLQQQAEAEAETNKQNEAILQELQPALEAIKAAKNRGARALLVFLKANHPPKFGRNLPEPEYDDLKRALRNASTDYHPDRQIGGDKLWQMLSQEISKHINEVWADYKS